MNSHESFVIVPGRQRSTSLLAQHLNRFKQRLYNHPYVSNNRIVRASGLRQHSDAMYRGRTTNLANIRNAGVATPLFYGPANITTSSASRYWPSTDTVSRVCQTKLVGSSLWQNIDVTREFDFNQEITESNLNAFIDEHLQPTMKFNQAMNQTVDVICRFFQRHMNPNKIVKGGSLGKGTAVNGMADIDLVLVLNDVTDARDLAIKLPRIKENMIRILAGHKRDLYVTSISTTRFSVKLTVKGRYEDIKVDVLPTFPFTDLNNLYQGMGKYGDYLQYYNAAVVEEQVNFVKDRPPNLKNLIRFVKYWRKREVTGNANARIPTSYVMELITIHLWEENTDCDGNFNTLKAFHGVMKTLANYPSLYVIWHRNYRLVIVSQGIKRPLMMDPANPENNVCERFSWDEIASAAKRQLSSPMLRGINSDSWK